VSPFANLSWAAVLLVVALAWGLRSRAYAVFRGVILSIYTLIAVAVLPHLSALVGSTPTVGPVLLGVVYYLHGVTYLDPALLVRPRLRPFWYRLLVSLPAQYMSASTLLAFPWAIASALGVTPHGAWVPYLLGVFGLLQSLRTRVEEHDLFVGEGVVEVPEQGRLAHPEARAKSSERPLRVVQITDPHLGPFMSVRRLSGICRRAVESDPDLIVLTGDFLTMESQADAAWLAEALAPLKEFSGKTFACLGNHDHEALGVVRTALASAEVRLLVDEQVTHISACGDVQILGFDFHFRDRARLTSEILECNRRDSGALRLVLLHDPGAFKHLPSGSADLVLSGHTHGGQVGLHSLGRVGTLVSALTQIPDHSLWARGTNRLWVHRGTGHYGFPLRLGVSAEESVLNIHRVASNRRAT